MTTTTTTIMTTTTTSRTIISTTTTATTSTKPRPLKDSQIEMFFHSYDIYKSCSRSRQKVWWLLCDDGQPRWGNQPEALARSKVRTLICKELWFISGKGPKRLQLEKGIKLFRETRELVTPQSLGQLEAQVTFALKK